MFIDKKKNTGFTLIEVLISSILGLMMISMIYSIYSAGNDIWEIKRYQTDLQAQGRQVMSAMATELRKTTRTSSQTPTPNLIIPASPNNKMITFYLPQINSSSIVTNATSGQIMWDLTNPIVYQYNAAQKEIRRTETTNASGNRTFAHDIANVQFIDNSIDASLYLNEVKVILFLSKTTPRQRNIAMNLSSIIRVRN